MREINITIDLEKNITSDNSKLGNKFDNEVTKLIFTIPELYNLPYKYCVFDHDQSNPIMFPLNVLDNSVIVTSLVSNRSGVWRVVLLTSDAEIVDGDIVNTSKIAVSNVLTMNIEDNDITDPIPINGLDANLEILYNELQVTVQYLNSEDFRELIDGQDGKSAYQTWLDLGNTGTESDFINYIKGPKGDPGTDGYTPIRGTDYWTAEDITTINNYIDSQIGTLNNSLENALNGGV